MVQECVPAEPTAWDILGDLAGCVAGGTAANCHIRKKGACTKPLLFKRRVLKELDRSNGEAAGCLAPSVGLGCIQGRWGGGGE